MINCRPRTAIRFYSMSISNN